MASSQTTLFSSSTCEYSIFKPDPFSKNSKLFNTNEWLGGKGVTRLPVGLKVSNTRPISATISFSLPTANPERVSSSDNVPQWSLKGIKSFAMGELEARKLKFATTGTEAILMGILVEGVDGEITTSHLLLGVWYQKEAAGHTIMATLGFNDEKAQELHSVISKPGFVED
ncbi:ATP-dependent Clp protease ATP-binding subunit ClpT2, chloroplastic-like protein [Tanacetum coccineum]